MRQVYFRVSMLIVVLFALRVEAVPDKIPTIVSANHVTFQAGNASSFTVTTTGTPAPSIAATGVLPSGITFVDGRGSNKGTGLLSGSAVRGSGGRYPITFTATNPHAWSSQSFALVVCDAIQITNPSATTALAGVPFSAHFTQTGGAGTTSFSIASGSLPAGLLLSAGGTVSGTPAGPGTSTIVVQATDANGCSGVSATWTLTVTSVPPVATADAYETADGAPMTVAAPGLFGNDALHGATLIGYGVNGNEQTTAGVATATQTGGSVAVALDGSFVYAPPAVSNIVQDVFRYTVANQSGSAIGTVTISLYPHACGTQPVSVSVTTARPGGPKDFDPYSLSATASSLDDDSSICPARFSHAPYGFNWSVNGPPKFSLSSNSGASTTLMVGATGSWTVTATAASQKSGDTATGSQTASIVTTCNPAPLVSPATIAGGAVGPHVGATGGDFNRNDVITLTASADFTACYSSPVTAASTFNWSLTGAALQNPNTASPSFIVDSPSKTYTAAVIVTDRWGNANAPMPQSFSSSSCGASPVNVFVSTASGNLPFDPYTLTASATSADDNAALCPARFAQSYNVLWSVAGGIGAKISLAPTTGPVTTFVTGSNGAATITATATGAKSGVTGSNSTTLNTSCASPAPVVTAPMIASVSPPPGDTFSRAPGQIFRDDTVTLTTAVSSVCMSSPVLTYAWSLSGNATLSSATSASPSFVAAASSAAYDVSVVATDQFGNSSAPASTTFTVSSCGANPATVNATATPSGLPMDPWTLLATVTSADDNASQCPARFANSSYAVTFSTTPPDGTTLSSSGFAATLTPGTPTQHTVAVTAQGSSGDPAGSTGLVIDSSCAPPTVPAPTISPVGVINAGDTVTLSAHATSACFSSPEFQYAWTVSGNGGPVTVTANGSTASFVAQGFSTTYTASVTVTDAGQATTSPSTSFTTSSCGSTPPTVVAQVVKQTIPSVNFMVDGQTPQTGDLTITMDPASGLPSTTIGTQTYVLPFYLGFPVVSQLAFGTSDCASFSFVSATATGPASSAPDVNVPAAQTVANGTVLPFTFTPASGDQFVLLNNIPTAQPALYQWFVNLGYGPSMTATVAVPAVHVAGVCGGNTPIASFNSDVVAGGSGTVRQPVQLASLVSDADNALLILANGAGRGCGLSQALTYSWSIVQAPDGSTATVSPSSGGLSSFVPDVAGQYTIRLVVTDSTGLSSAPFVQSIIVANAPSP